MSGSKPRRVKNVSTSGIAASTMVRTLRTPPVPVALQHLLRERPPDSATGTVGIDTHHFDPPAPLLDPELTRADVAEHETGDLAVDLGHHRSLGGATQVVGHAALPEVGLVSITHLLADPDDAVEIELGQGTDLDRFCRQSATSPRHSIGCPCVRQSSPRPTRRRVPALRVAPASLRLSAPAKIRRCPRSARRASPAPVADRAALVALLAVQVIFATLHVVGKVVLAEIPALAFASSRVLIAAPFLAILAWSHDRVLPARRDWAALTLLGLLGVFANQVLYLVGLRFTTATNAAILMPSIPVFTVAAAAVLGAERLTTRRVAGVALAAVGALVLLDPARLELGGQTAFGNLLVAGNCLCYAFYLVLLRPLLARLPWRTVVAGAFVTGGTATLLVSLPTLAGRLGGSTGRHLAGDRLCRGLSHRRHLRPQHLGGAAHFGLAGRGLHHPAAALHRAPGGPLPARELRLAAGGRPRPDRLRPGGRLTAQLTPRAGGPPVSGAGREGVAVGDRRRAPTQRVEVAARSSGGGVGRRQGVLDVGRRRGVDPVARRTRRRRSTTFTSTSRLVSAKNQKSPESAVSGYECPTPRRP